MDKFQHPETVGKEYSVYRLLIDTLSLIKPYKWRFLIASLIRLAGDLVSLYPAYALAYIINTLTNYTSGQSLTSLWIVVSIWFVVVLVRSLSIFVTKYLGFQVSEQVSLDAQLQTFQHMIKLDMSWHERENSRNKLKRVQNGGGAFDRLIRIWFNSLIEIGVNFIGMVFIISRFDRLAAALVVTFLVTYFIVSRLLTKPAARASYNVSVAEEKVQGILFETISNIRTIKVMSIASPLMKLVRGDMTALFQKIKQRVFRFQSRNGVLHFWGYAFRLGGIVLAIIGILHGRYDIGFIVLFAGYFDKVWESVREFSDASQDIVIARQNISRMKDITNEQIRIDDEHDKQPFPRSWKSIQVQDLSFAYGNNKVLDNISFTIQRGEKVGIVGLSGAGKSTLFKLLLKEHENYNGHILINDLPLKTISKRDYFNYISVVFQDTEVFNFSLRDNITLVNEAQRSNKKLLTQAMDVAHVSDFIHKLPDGIDTLIGEKGIKLSGGEKQRLGIARAIFKEPQILLLDEATSHLDLESEEKIRDSLHKFFQNVTAVVIAHRLTTIREMDKILVIENGRIVESGNFDELSTQRGRFFELWEKQKL